MYEKQPILKALIEQGWMIPGQTMVGGAGHQDYTAKYEAGAVGRGQRSDSDAGGKG